VERFTDLTPGELAQAMEACAPSLLAAEFRLPDGALPDATQLAAMSDFQSAVLLQLGAGGLVPRSGPTFVALSSGQVSDFDSPFPFQIPLQPGTNLGTSGLAPAVLLAAHDGHLPAYPSCFPASNVNDPVTLRLTLQVPAVATRLAIDWLFFSANYSEWTCTSFDDYFLIMVDGSSPALPEDRNLALDSAGHAMSTMHNDYHFCLPAGIWACPGGTGALAGTGCEGGIGGATAWHVAMIPVVGGETLTLDLAVFDVGDHVNDTAVLIDGLRWLAD
jgi:hypothetical protein